MVPLAHDVAALAARWGRHGRMRSALGAVGPPLLRHWHADCVAIELSCTSSRRSFTRRCSGPTWHRTRISPGSSSARCYGSHSSSWTVAQPVPQGSPAALV